MASKYVQTNTFYQAGSGSIIGATSIVLTSFADIYGIVLTMTDFGAKGYGTLEPDTTNEEAFTFTGVVANANGTYTLTGVSTALAKSPYTETSGLVRAHSGGTKMVVTDNVAFWNTFANKNNDETIVGKYTFPHANRPTMDSDADSAVATDLVTVGQLSRQAISGAANASPSVKGIVQEATQAQVDARTVAGSTGAELYAPLDKIRSSKLSDYVASDTGSANTYVIAPVPAFPSLSAGQRYIFKAATANTGVSTLAVNGLAATTIKKNGTLDLSPNDILVGQIVEVMYDGTNMILLSPIASNVLPTGLIQPFAGNVIPTGFLLCDGSAVSRTTYAALLSVIAPAQTFTVTLASPGVFSATAHGLQIGDKIRLTTTGALPTGLATATDYFVITAGFGANSFQVSASRGGAAVNTSGSQSGVHTMRFSNWGVGDGSTTFNVPDLRGFTIYGQKTSDTNFDNLNAPTVYPGEKTHTLVIAEMPSHTHPGNYGSGNSSSFIAGAGQSNVTQSGTVPSQGGDGAHNNMPPYAVAQYLIKT